MAEVKVAMPFTLKKQLVTDWEHVTQEPRRLVRLPRESTVADVMSQYMESKAKRSTPPQTSRAQELMDGVRIYFDKVRTDGLGAFPCHDMVAYCPSAHGVHCSVLARGSVAMTSESESEICVGGKSKQVRRCPTDSFEFGDATSLEVLNPLRVLTVLVIAGGCFAAAGAAFDPALSAGTDTVRLDYARASGKKSKRNLRGRAPLASVRYVKHQSVGGVAGTDHTAAPFLL